MTEEGTSERNETRLAVMSEKIGNIERTVSESRKENKELRDDIKDLSNKIDDTYATKADLSDVKLAAKTELDNTQKEVDSIKNNINWIVKIIVGAVVVAILGVVVVQNK